MAAFVVGGLALAALVPVERRRRAPMLRLSLFASRQFDAINATTVLFYGALTAAGYLTVIEFELKLGYTASQAGAALIPATAVFLVLAPLSGALVSRIGPRWPMVAGILLVGVSLVWLAQLHRDSGYLTAVLPPALVRGAGLGLAVTPLTAAVLAAVGDSDLGEASGVNDAAARVGGVIAIALVPVLIGVGAGGSLAASLTHGYRPAMLVDRRVSASPLRSSAGSSSRTSGQTLRAWCRPRPTAAVRSPSSTQRRPKPRRDRVEPTEVMHEQQSSRRWSWPTSSSRTTSSVRGASTPTSSAAGPSSRARGTTR